MAHDGSDKLRFLFVGLISVAVFIGFSSTVATEFKANSSNSDCPSFHEVRLVMTTQEALHIQIPKGFRIYPSLSDPDEKFLLRESPVLGGRDIKEVDVETADFLSITFRFTAAAAHTLEIFTSNNINQQLAILLDDSVIWSAQIREPITTGSIGLRGGLRNSTTRQLADKLRSGICR